MKSAIMQENYNLGGGINIYPWQEKDYIVFDGLTNNLPHALLLSANTFCGQGALVKSYTMRLLCEAPKSQELGGDVVKRACGECQSCTLFINNSHPDYYLLTPDLEESKKNISVDIIRSMVEFLALTPHISSKKIVVLPNTDWLNISSANALLKTLEEPPTYVTFVLQTTNLSNVLPTIKSRCYKYTLKQPEFSVSLNYLERLDVENPKFWLTYYDNAPLFELEINQKQLQILVDTLLKPSIDNVFAACTEFDGKKVNFGFVLEFLSKWLQDLVASKLNSDLKYFVDYHESINKLSMQLQLERAFFLHDQINFLLNWSTHPLNYKLQLENLLLQYQSAFSK
jgi:DNA polymerase III subunit delta'